MSSYAIVTDSTDFGIGLHEGNASVNVEVTGSNVVIFNEEDIETVLEVIEGSVGVDSPAATLSDGVGEDSVRKRTGYIIDVVDGRAVVCNMPQDLVGVDEVFLECGDSTLDFRQAVVGDDADYNFVFGGWHKWYTTP